MALKLSKIPQAISQIMAGIDDGLSQAANYVDSVRPPEKVNFSADAIVVPNSIERIRTIVTSPSVKTTLSPNVVEMTVFNGDATGLPPVPFEVFSKTTETTSKKEFYIRNREDQAIGFSFDYPGPKSS